MMTTSRTGNKRYRESFFNQSAYTFMEVMVTITILSIGLIVIYKTLLVSLDRMNYLTNRLYASNLLDNRIAVIERMLRSQKVLPFEADQKETVKIGNKDIDFNLETVFSDIDNFLDVFKLDLSVSWQEQGRELHLVRSAFISDFESASPK